MKIYVGTYAKYNNGDIGGALLDLSDYGDKDEFYAACAELHKDESDPKFMFQDFDPEGEDWITESSIDGAVFDFLALDDDDQEMVRAYMDVTGSKFDDDTLSNAQDALTHKGSSESDLDDEMVDLFLECCGVSREAIETLYCYLDREKIARDMKMDYSIAEVNGTHYAFHL